MSMIDIRGNLTEAILEVGTSATREMIDLPDYHLRSQGPTWELLKVSMRYLDELWKIPAGGRAPTMSVEQRDVRELIKRRMDLLSTKLDPQEEPVQLCYAKKSKAQDSEYCILQRDHEFTNHVGNHGSTWTGIVAS